MLRYMLDTDTASFVMKKNMPSVLKRLESVPMGDICISAIAFSELAFGAEVSPAPKRDQARLDLLLRHVSVLEYPSGAAAHYAEIRAFLKKRGTIIGANDLFIAAHARCEGLTLVTNNRREFLRVPGLQIENWC
jgi:tRNA(fMet)-specific endonuclease VapC